jgi:hypothetical protein
MAVRSKSSKKGATTGKFVLGSQRFAKISAVEGIKRTSAMKKRSAAFDKKGLSTAERRQELLKVYRKKA